MSLWQTFRLALVNLASHKLRSLLAVLGIILGVASVEVMSSIVQGAKQESLRRFTILGVDTIRIVSVKPGKTGHKKASDSARQDASSAHEYGLLRRDLSHIRKTVPDSNCVTGLRDMRTILYDRTGRELDLRVVAAGSGYLQVVRPPMAHGRFLTGLDEAGCKRVAVLGHDAARKLLALQTPLQSHVRIAGRWYQVVGVLGDCPSPGNAVGGDMNRSVFIPLSTARLLHGDVSSRSQPGGSESVRVEMDEIAIRLDDMAEVLPVARQIRAYLEAAHKKDDYQIHVPQELMRQKQAQARTFAVVMGSIAGISLVVGGIGIMNIMLANVSDRRREIGTRRALGARQRDILCQFLFEAATLTVCGGLIGVALGLVCEPLIGAYARWPTTFSGWSAVLGVGVSGFIGIVFGLWPAWQAARLHPIQSLRAE